MEPRPFPVIGVMPQLETKGLEDVRITAGVGALTCLPLEQAITTQWDTEALFVPYYPVHPIEGAHPRWPRINKSGPALSQIRAGGEDLVTEMLVIEWDTPGHQPWTEGLLRSFMLHLESMAESCPLSWAWTCMYTTRAGCRFIYVLKDPIPVDISEGHWETLRQRLHSGGLLMDANCKDWTRSFRLPFITRDGVKTWCDQAIPVQIFWQRDQRLDVNSLGTLAEMLVVKPTNLLSGNPFLQSQQDLDWVQPSPDQARLLMEIPQGGKIKPTQFANKAKRRLIGRECFPCIFEMQSIGTAGMNRNNNIFSYVGQSISLLMGLQGVTPAHIYALFYPAVSQLDPDHDNPDWTATLWDNVKRLWQRNEGKITAVEFPDEQVPVSHDTLATMDAIMLGMQQWCTHPIMDYVPDLEQDPQGLQKMDPLKRAEIHEWIMRRLIINAADTVVLMSPNGWYDTFQLSQRQLISRWRITGMDSIAPSKVMNQNGTWRDCKIDEMLNQYSTPVRTVEALPCLPGSKVEDLDGKNPRLIVSAYDRNPYIIKTADWDPEVDEWLRRFFMENYDKGCSWIAYALAFDEGPTAAISIKGPPGMGKKMFVQGLAECLVVPKVADAEDMTGTTQYGLMDSPFLSIDEEWPGGHASIAKHPAAAFRQLVGGQPILIKRKFLAPTTLYSPARIIMTANNLSVVRKLTEGREFSPEDRKALSDRLLHFDLSDSTAPKYLASRGGLEYTSTPGARWIAGDSGAPSNYKIARHFMYLYLNRAHWKKGSRFLVTGGNDIKIIEHMKTRTGSTPVVIETLITLIKNAERVQTIDGIKLDFINGKIWCLSKTVLEAWRRTDNQKEKTAINCPSICNAFRGLLSSGAHSEGSLVPWDRQRRRWFDIDPGILSEVAKQDGWDCPPLDRLVEAKVNSINAMMAGKTQGTR